MRSKDDWCPTQGHRAFGHRRARSSAVDQEYRLDLFPTEAR
jgi:hypothetical protein